MKKIRVHSLVQNSTINGPGINLVVVVQGCTRSCPDCHNPDTHSLKGGRMLTADTILKAVTHITTGVTLSGGEPFLQVEELEDLLHKVKQRGLLLNMYTGNTLEELELNSKGYSIIAKYVDYIKVGPYLKDKKSLSSMLAGSSNQEWLRFKRTLSKDGNLILVKTEAVDISTVLA